jgi:hypothetical protein
VSENKKETVIYTLDQDLEPFDTARPEKDLLRAILLSALADVERGGIEARRALDYFNNPADNYIFSFKSICNHLDMPQSAVMDEVKRRMGQAG